VEHFVFCHPDSSLLNTAVFCLSVWSLWHAWHAAVEDARTDGPPTDGRRQKNAIFCGKKSNRLVFQMDDDAMGCSRERNEDLC
jgi:hypothetical protein